MNLYDILIQSSTAALSLQDSEQGFMPPGHNGSYQDPETPVRNTAHWLITFLKAYEISSQKKFLNAAQQATSYLCSDEARPMDASFWHRKNPHKDTCNGLMGQAWTIEALTIAAHSLEMPELLALAEKVFLLHPQDTRTGLWRCVSADGTYLDFDNTFNHQLWFAAAGTLLAKASCSEDIDLSVREFLKNLPVNFQVYKSGLIKHFVSLELFPSRVRIDKLYAQTWQLRYLEKVIKSNRYLKQKEIGYHSFNLYAFALIKQVHPDHPFWSSPSFSAALQYIESEAYHQQIQVSKYGFPYNPPGFEIPFILEVFSDVPDKQLKQSQWVSRQLSRCYNFEAHLMNKDTADPMTHAARIYEATRLKDLALDDFRTITRCSEEEL